MPQTRLIRIVTMIALTLTLAWNGPGRLSAQQSDTSTVANVQTWQGKLDTPHATLRIRFELTPEGDGFKGVLVSPDQGNARLQISDVQISGDDFKLTLDRPKATYVGKLSLDRKSVQGTWQQGGQPLELNLRLASDEEEEADVAPKETWKGTLNAGVKLEIQVRFFDDPDSKEEYCYFDSLSQGVSGLKATCKKEDGQLILEVPAVQGKFAGKLSEDGATATGMWSQGAIKLPLKLVKTDEVAEAVEIRRPQHPTPPYGYRTEDVIFPSKQDGVTLAGTLTLPEAAESGKRFVAAILVSGSGPQDRDETLLGHKPFLVIADHLTKQGIAVLRFDDRGTGDSTGDHDVATTEDFANDVRGGIAYLRSRAEVDPQKIGIIGHSEGGLIGPLVTANDPRVAFLVMLAGPGVDGGQIILNQAPAISRASGESEDAVALQHQQLTQLIASIKQGANKEQIDTLVETFAKQIEEQASADGDDSTPETNDLKDLVMAGFERMQTPWFRFFLTYDPIPTLEKTRCPVLSLIGEKDLQVDPKLNMPPIRSALDRAGNAKTICKELAGLNHLFQECETGAVHEYQTIEQTFAPSALQLMSDWILGLDEDHK